MPDIESELWSLIENTKILGNNSLDYGFKELCSDAINQFGTDKKSMERLADGTGLSTTTLRRMATLTESETGEPYHPQDDTMERILRFFQVECSFNIVKLKAKYRNQPKRIE